MHTIGMTTDYKHQAKILRDGLTGEGLSLGHGKALEIIARIHGARDWNTLSAKPATTSPVQAEKTMGFSLGASVHGTVHGKPAKGRIVGLEETVNPDLTRMTVHFDPPVDVSTSDLFEARRSRITMVFGKDGRSKRLTGTDAGGIELKAI